MVLSTLATRRLLRIGGVAFCLAAVSSNCNAQFGGVFNNNNVTGGLVGGIAGAVIGNKFAGRGNRELGTLLGAAIGASLGAAIANILNANQASALQQQKQVAVSNQPDGTQSTWTAPDNSASGTVTTSNTRDETKQISIVRDASVTEPPALELIGKSYVARNATDVHAAPDENSAQTAALTRGSTIWAVGKVADAPWIMIARHGKSIGYVASGDVHAAPPARPRPHPVLARAPAPSAAAPQLAETAAPTSVDLDDAPVRSSVDLDKLPADERSTVVTASVSCRDVTSTAQSAKGSATETQTVCKSPDGSWDLDAGKS